MSQEQLMREEWTILVNEGICDFLALASIGGTALVIFGNAMAYLLGM